MAAETILGMQAMAALESTPETNSRREKPHFDFMMDTSLFASPTHQRNVANRTKLGTLRACNGRENVFSKLNI